MTPFTDEDRALLQAAAAGIVARRMALPAMMFLETVAPMNTVSAAMLHMLTPIWSVVLPAQRLRQLAALLEQREAIPELIATIDAAEAERRATEAERRAAEAERKRAHKAERAAKRADLQPAPTATEGAERSTPRPTQAETRSHP